MKKEKKKQKRKKQAEKIKIKNYQAVKNMTKEEKEKYYNEYYNQKILFKEKQKENLLEGYNSNFIPQKKIHIIKNKNIFTKK